MNAVEFARELIDIDSTTGREQEAGEWLRRSLRSLGYRVDEQPVRQRAAKRRRDDRRAGGRALDALRLRPAALPELGSRRPAVRPRLVRREGHPGGAGRLRSNGCAQSGETRVGMLFVVGEERGSDGADVANANPIGSQFLINGEPTDSRLAIATRGNLRVRLRATGRAAHSAAPEHGVSAIDKLLDALMQLRDDRRFRPIRSSGGPTTASA